MTDDEALRLGCEVVGLAIGTSGISDHEGYAALPGPLGYKWTWRLDDPALPAYVAELLVAKVLKRNLYRRTVAHLQGYIHPDQHDAQALALTDTTPIEKARAALVALGHEAAGEVE